MKKRYLLAVLLIALCLCLTCCNNADIEGVNELFRQVYSKLDVTVVTEKDGLSLTTVYNVTYDKTGTATVNYRCERFNVIDIDNPTLVRDAVNVTTGSYTDNEHNFVLSRLCFDKTTFNKFTQQDGKLICTINNGKQYVDADYNCNDFVMTITYTDVLQSVTMSYVLDDNTQCTVTCIPSK